MATIYVNKGGFDDNDGTAEVDQTGGLGGGVGPYLTANVAMDAYDSSSKDGDTLKFGDGTFTYTLGDGRYILSHASSNIIGTTSYGTTLVFSGSNVQGLRYNADGGGSEARTATFGEIKVQYSSAKEELVYISGSGSAAKITVNWSGYFDGLQNKSDMSLLRLAVVDIDLNVLVGAGATGTNTSTFNGLIFAPGLGDDSNINVEAFACDGVSAQLASARGGIILEHTLANATGSVLIKGLTGTLTDLSTGSGTSYGVNLISGPDGMQITECDNFEIVAADSDRDVCAFCISSPAADSLSADDARIHNNRNVVVNTQDGFCAAIGGEGGVDHNCARGIIENNDIRGVAGTFVGLHGIAHIGCLDGIRRSNKIGNAALGSLTKIGTAISYDNYYYNIGGTSDVYLYAKGAEDGTEFINETCEIASGFDGNIEQALDNDGGQVSTNILFRGTKVTRKGSADLAAGAKMYLNGSGVEISTSSTIGMTIDSALTIPTVVASISGSTFATIALANAEATVESMTQNTIRDLASSDAYPSSGGGSRSIIGSVIG